MSKIGLFFGTDTGNTEAVSEKIVESLVELTGQDIVESNEIYQKKAEDVAKYDLLIFGQPTWYDGELQGDWEEFIPELKKIDQKILNYIYIESKYSSYLERQNVDIKMFIDEEILVIPSDIDYTTIKSLSNEVIEKLKFANPLTLGAARRIPGITPAAIMSILIHIKTADVKR